MIFSCSAVGLFPQFVSGIIDPNDPQVRGVHGFVPAGTGFIAAASGIRVNRQPESSGGSGNHSFEIISACSAERFVPQQAPVGTEPNNPVINVPVLRARFIAANAGGGVTAYDESPVAGGGHTLSLFF